MEGVASRSDTSLEQGRESALTDEVAAASGPHGGGMDGVGGNVAAFTGAIGFRFTGHCEGHFTGEDKVCCFHAVSVVGIAGIRAVFPNEDVRKTFAVQLGGETGFVHERDFSPPDTRMKASGGAAAR